MVDEKVVDKIAKQMHEQFLYDPAVRARLYKELAELYLDHHRMTILDVIKNKARLHLMDKEGFPNKEIESED